MSCDETAGLYHSPTGRVGLPVRTVSHNLTLRILGAVITNAHRRRKITEHVRVEVGRLYPLLGTIRADARLLYATTAGTIHRLRTSKALDDYAKVVEQLRPVLP